MQFLLIPLFLLLVSSEGSDKKNFDIDADNSLPTESGERPVFFNSYDYDCFDELRDSKLLKMASTIGIPIMHSSLQIGTNKKLRNKKPIEIHFNKEVQFSDVLHLQGTQMNFHLFQCMTSLTNAKISFIIDHAIKEGYLKPYHMIKNNCHHQAKKMLKLICTREIPELKEKIPCVINRAANCIRPFMKPKSLYKTKETKLREKELIELIKNKIFIMTTNNNIEQPYWTISKGAAIRTGWSCRQCHQKEHIVIRDGRKMRFFYHERCFEGSADPRTQSGSSYWENGNRWKPGTHISEEAPRVKGKGKWSVQSYGYQPTITWGFSRLEKDKIPDKSK